VQLFLIASFLGFVFMSVLVGGRLVSVWLRTRQLPELLLGISTLVLGGIAYPVGAVVTSGEVEVAAFWRSWLSVGANVACHLAYALVLAFTVKVFRPGAIWASRMQWPIWMIQAAATWLFGVEIVRTLGHSEQVATWVSCVNLVAPILIFGWTAVESLHAHLKARRRLALGLIDAVVANRMLMWAGFGGAIAVGAAQSFVCEVLEIPYMQVEWAQAMMSALGLAETAFLALAFFPPAAYRSWILRRASKAG
jgi:hypothetical protein